MIPLRVASITAHPGIDHALVPGEKGGCLQVCSQVDRAQLSACLGRFGQQGIHQVRTDKPGTTGDEAMERRMWHMVNNGRWSIVDCQWSIMLLIDH